MEICTPIELKLIVDVMKQWCPPSSPELRAILGAYIIAGSKHHSAFTRCFLQRVGQMASWMLELPARDTLVNGYLYYISNLLFAMCHYTTLEQLHGPAMWTIVDTRILKISLVCVIADFVLDTVTADERKIVGQQVFGVLKSMMTKTAYTAPLDPRIQSAATILQGLIQEVPAALPTVMATFAAEVASGAQKDGKPSYADLLRLEGKKGALTFELVGVIINNGVSLKVPPDLGYVIQLYDDLADMYIDAKEATWTVVSDRIAMEGSVDRLLYEMAGAIARLPTLYWPFKVLCTLCMGAIASTNPYVSPSLTKLLRPYALMVNRGKDREDLPLYRDAIYAHVEYNMTPR